MLYGSTCRWPLLAAVVGSLVAVGVVVHLTGIQAPDGKAVPKTGAEAVVAATTARIAEESRAVPLPPRAVPPPAAERPRTPSERLATDQVPVPPPGYVYVEHFGEMAKGTYGKRAPDPPGGPDWLDSTSDLATLAQQATEAGRDWTFGWIRLADNATRGDLEHALAATGGEVIGAAGRMIRARLPGDRDRLAAVRALAAVAGIGATPGQAKLEGFGEDPLLDPSGRTPVFVTLMPDDRDGRWRRALEELGAVVGGYDPALRVYRASVRPESIEALAASDFVLAVAPIRVVEAAHDTAVPALGADALRTYADSPGWFSGSTGGSVPVGVMDTGLNINHLDIASHRGSICGANFASDFGDPFIETDDLWIDANGHGTHVTGTLAGNGFGERRFAGVAPGVRHIRFAKVLSIGGYGSDDDIMAGMDFLATESGCGEPGQAVERVRPRVVNMSLSAIWLYFEGRDAGARKLDWTVWTHRQLYVVAQANSGRVAFSNYGAAKNSLAVGAAKDGGELASFSSLGPTADGRLAPNVVGTGVRVYSALGDGSRGGYRAFDGTSMASPAVAGVAALLMDAVPAHKEQPALARARLMASAVRPDHWLVDGGGFATDNTAGPGPVQAGYGMGKVSAHTAVLNRDGPDGWRSGSAVAELEDGEYAHHDIEVPAGASRLDVVLTWDEPPADAVASTVLNDLDLWLDRDADCGSAECGEHSSRSRLDNVEWIVVRNPSPGTYRVKVLAHRVYTAPPRAAVAWTVIRGASTPTLVVEADRQRIAGAGEHQVTVTLGADSYVAAGTRLHVDCRATGSTTCDDLVTIEEVAVTRADGVTVDPASETLEPVPPGYAWNEQPVLAGADHEDDPGWVMGWIGLGMAIPIGDVAAGDRREVTFQISLAAGAEVDDGASLHFTASGWNARAGSAIVAVGPGDAPDTERPANDDFASATVIEGAEGTLGLDLLRATPEPGEPLFDGNPSYGSVRGRPAGSLWYAWTATSDGPFRFAVPALARGMDERLGDVLRYDRVHVFGGDRLAALRELASGLWGTTFFAEEGRTYRIRVASSSRGAAMDLRWSPAPRPANDDFANAIVLDGATGSAVGTTDGATLEPGEWFGQTEATTWFRWTAPDDGNWKFECPECDYSMRVLVFEGEGIASLRLVGGARGDRSSFPAGGGREYRIAVGQRPGRKSGQQYSLHWDDNGNIRDKDMFANAGSIGESSSVVVKFVGWESVEPGEPPETGIRTQWWSWKPPERGTYTWRRVRNWDYSAMSDDFAKLRVTLFSGTAIDDLHLVAESGPGEPFEFLLDASEESYWIATGFGNGDPDAFDQPFNTYATLEWGATPDNDEASGAAMIAGATGSVSGSSAFATGARGERSDILGRSTLWWIWEAAESGWVRFAADGEGGPWALTAHREAADAGLDILAATRWQRTDGEVLFNAESGVRYVISLGVRGGGRGGDFTLRWEQADEPTWLRYVGRLADGERDPRGNPVTIRHPGNLAIHASGTALYLASEIGLDVFARDSARGRLFHVQSIGTDIDLARSSLVWDAYRERLLADECGAWRSFPEVGDGPELGAPVELTAVDDPGRCADRLLMDAAGTNVYRLTGSLQHFDIEEDGGLRYVEEVGLDDHLRGAVISSDGRHIYATSDEARLRVFERDPSTGRLTRNDFSGDIESYGVAPLAITDDDRHLFVYEIGSMGIFALDDRSRPERLATLSQFWDAHWLSTERCRFADARSEAVAVDVFCPGLAITARWDAGTSELTGTDWLSPRQGDKFNGLPLPNFGEPVGFAASPDGDHVYVATPAHGVLIFARTFPGEEEVQTFYEAGDTIETLPTGLWTADNLSGATAASHNGGVRLDFDNGGYVEEGDHRYTCEHVGGCEVDDRVVQTGKIVETSVLDTVTIPDLVVESPSVSDSTPATGAPFTFTARVRNRGTRLSAATTVRYYRSADTTVSPTDILVGSHYVASLAASTATDESIDLTALIPAGTYYYGACADEVPGEADSANNCSAALPVTVQGPDLVVQSPAVNDARPSPGGTFTLYATVRNSGAAASAASTVRFYRSTDDTISTGDVELGSASVPGLAVSGSRAEAIDLTAPADAGTYYFGACVDPVLGESETGNNCSTAATVTVAAN